MAGGLRGDLGLAPGDRVAILMRNRPEYLEAMFGIWHAGLVAVPVNARLHPDEIAYILEHSGTSVVLTDDDHVEDVEPLVGSLASLQAAVVAPGDRWDGPHRRGAGSRSRADGPTTPPGSSTRAAPRAGRRAPRSRTATC